jgi:hypothetical protein
MFKKSKCAGNKKAPDTRIEMYCRGVEELLNNISKKCDSRKNKETFEEEHYDFTEDFEDSYRM